MFYFNLFKQAKYVLCITSLTLISTPLWAENAPAAILTTQAPAVGLQENRAVLTLDQAIQLAQQYQPLQTL